MVAVNVYCLYRLKIVAHQGCAIGTSVCIESRWCLEGFRLILGPSCGEVPCPYRLPRIVQSYSNWYIYIYIFILIFQYVYIYIYFFIYLYIDFLIEIYFQTRLYMHSAWVYDIVYFRKKTSGASYPTMPKNRVSLTSRPNPTCFILITSISCLMYFSSFTFEQGSVHPQFVRLYR